MDTESILRELTKYIFIGVVSQYGEKPGTVIVTRPDQDNRTTAELYIVSRGTKETKDYWMPVIDDQVLCLLLPNVSGKGPSTGYVLGAIYSETDRLPTGAEPSAIILDHPGDMVLNIGGTFRVNAGTLDVHGGGDVVASGISLVKHVHGEVMPGSSDTGSPH